MVDNLFQPLIGLLTNVMIYASRFCLFSVFFSETVYCRTKEEDLLNRCWEGGEGVQITLTY